MLRGMSDPSQPTPSAETPEIVERSPDGDASPEAPSELVSQPAKVMRVGSMIKQLLDEVRTMTLDEASRERLREIYDLTVHELSSALSTDLADELERLRFPFEPEGVPTEAEIRLAKAQLVGWLEGLFHGIQATLFAQQMAARQQLDNMRQQLPPGAGGEAPAGERPGIYL
jgi:hypothetical protein